MQIAFCKKYMIRGKMMSCFKTESRRAASPNRTFNLQPYYNSAEKNCKAFERRF